MLHPDTGRTPARAPTPPPPIPRPYYIRAKMVSAYSRDGGGADVVWGPLRASVPPTDVGWGILDAYKTGGRALRASVPPTDVGWEYWTPTKQVDELCRRPSPQQMRVEQHD
jgi:hypothetical protein